MFPGFNSFLMLKKSLFCDFWDHEFCQLSSSMLSSRIFIYFTDVRSSGEITMADLACWSISSFPSMPTCPGINMNEAFNV